MSADVLAGGVWRYLNGHILFRCMCANPWFHVASPPGFVWMGHWSSVSDADVGSSSNTRNATVRSSIRSLDFITGSLSRFVRDHRHERVAKRNQAYIVVDMARF